MHIYNIYKSHSEICIFIFTQCFGDRFLCFRPIYKLNLLSSMLRCIFPFDSLQSLIIIFYHLLILFWLLVFNYKWILMISFTCICFFAFSYRVFSSKYCTLKLHVRQHPQAFLMSILVTWTVKNIGHFKKWQFIWNSQNIKFYQWLLKFLTPTFCLLSFLQCRMNASW